MVLLVYQAWLTWLPSSLMFFQVQVSAWAEIIALLIGIAISTIISVGVYKERIGNIYRSVEEMKADLKADRDNLRETLSQERLDFQAKLAAVNASSESRSLMLNNTIMELTRDIGRLEGNIRDRRPIA